MENFRRYIENKIDDMCNRRMSEHKAPDGVLLKDLKDEIKKDFDKIMRGLVEDNSIKVSRTINDFLIRKK